MKKNILFSLIILAFTALILFFVFFYKSGKTILQFGSLLPLSGQVSAYGEMMQRGQLIAIEDIKNDYKDSVNIKFYNTEHKKDVALSRLKEAKNNGIKYFVEIFGSDQLEHCLDYVINNNLFVISGVDTKPDLIEQGKGHFFRIMPNDAEATLEIFMWMKEMQLKKIAIIYVNDDWGTGLLNSALYNLRKIPLELVTQIDINKSQQSFSATVAKLKESNPDAICLFIYPDDGGRLIKETFRQGLKAHFFATENFTGNDMIKTAQQAAIGVKLIVPSLPENNVLYKKFTEKYQNKYHEKPTIFAIKGYDATLVLYDVLKQAKEKGNANLNNILSDSYSFHGASGKIGFDKTGEFNGTSYERCEYQEKDHVIQLINLKK